MKAVCYFKIIPFVFVLTGGLFAQQSFEKDYAPIKSSGLIPDVLILNPQKKIKKDLEEIAENDKKILSVELTHNIHANYAIDKALHGGNILINDEITVYVNKVVDKLLINKPEIRKDLSLFVTKVPEVNAYSMGKGYVFINVGLIAKVENEAQLAMVLAHEISHNILRHSFNTYVKAKKISQDKSIGTFEDRLLHFFAFSKENEFQADSLGLEIYKTSNYDVDAVVPVFDVLKYSYLPIEEIPFDSAFFNDSYYHLPAKYFLKKNQPVKDNEEYDDAKSTHPNIAKRKDRMKELLDTESAKKGTNIFEISKSDFLKIRDECRFELCRLFMIERNYFNSIITANVLLKKYPDNAYLKEVIAKSIYAIALYKEGILKYSQSSYRSGPIPDFTHTEGYSQQLNYLMDRIPQKEMIVLSLRYCWEQHRKYPENANYSYQCDTLLRILTKKHRSGISEYFDKIPDSGAKAEDYYKYAFVDLFSKDSGFKSAFEQYTLQIPAENQVILKAFVPPTKNSTKTPKKEAAPSEVLSIKKIIVVNPFYLAQDERVSETDIYSITDKRERAFIDMIRSDGEKKKIELNFLDPDDLSSEDVEKYNDFSVMNDWFNERMEGGVDQNFPPINSNEIPSIIKKYGTKYALWLGVYSLSEKAGLVNNNHFTFYNSLLFDLETGKVVSEKKYLTDKGDSSFRIGDYVDDTFDAIAEKNAN